MPQQTMTPGVHTLGRSARRRRGGRRTARVLTLILTLLCAIGLASLGPATGPATARADGIQLSGPGYAPPDLLNPGQLAAGTYAATSGQLQSLQKLETTAISNTLHDHGLPAGDAAAVQSWGRADAEAELFALLVQAITTSSCSTSQTPGQGCRTTDQKNAVDWLTAVVQRNNVQAAQDAGLEYVKWSGLDQAQYQNLLASNASESTLQNFFTVTPINYNNSNPSLATGGYCVYQPPAPYQSEYSDRGNQTCSIPCTSSAGCIPTGPTYNQFVKWGAADANNQLFNNNDFAQTSRDIAVGVGVGAGVAAGVTGLSVGAAFVGSLGTYGGTAAGTIILPYATVGATAAAVAGLAVIVIAAIAIGVVYAINVFNAAAVPGELASLIASAPTTTPDLGAMLTDPTQGTGLFGLFVGATLPAPRRTSCDNSTLPILIGSATNPNPIPAPCLNAPSIPAPANTDPIFAVTAKGASTRTYATTLTWADTTAGLTTTARLSGTWFIDQAATSAGTTDATQTLRIHYTDWSDQGQTAWLLGDPTNGYKFLRIADQTASGTPLDPSTCLTDNTCSYSSSIDYVGADGQDYSAQVLPAPLPTVNPSTSANPLEGSPVTFTANGSSPLGLPLTYQWTFEQVGVGGMTTFCLFGCPVTSGAQVSNTWPTSGYFHVQVIATDPLGKQTTDDFGVTVGDVPPTLALWPTLTSTNQFGCEFSFPSCETHTTPLGGVTRLDGTIAHAGSADTESVDVNWGDGTPDDLANIGSLTPLQSSNVTLSTFTSKSFNLSASHSYAAGGTYPVTVTVTDQAGGTAVVTTTENVARVTSLTWPAPAAITYGTALGATQLDAAASVTTTVAGPAVGVPGTFAYSVDGGPVTPPEVLPAGPHTLTVQFTPNDTTRYTTPAAVAVPLTVNQAPLTITAGSPTMVYNGTVPAITPGYSGFVNGESAASLTTLPTCTSGAPGAGTAGTYQTTCAGAVDANYSIGYVPGTLTIGKAGTSTTLSSSPNPAVSGQTVTLTATVAVKSPGAGHPGGTVEFKDGAGDIGGCAAEPVDTTTETATCATSALGVAAHGITASYGGDTNFSGSTSPAVTQTVTKAAVTATLGSSGSPATHGQTVTFTATVAAAAPGAGTPTGTVTFTDGATALGAGTLRTSNGATVATFTTSGLGVGTHTIMATYGGDGHFLASTGVTLTQYINTNLSGYPTLSSGAYNLSNANLAGGYFVNAPLAGASLSGAKLTSAVFSGANLTGANLSNSNFMGGATFTNATLQNANLSNSNLKGANFTGTNLTGANLSNSNLMGATGLKTATLTNVVWYKTACPDGTNSSNDGGTCLGHL